MAEHRERVLEFLANFSGRDDDEIACALRIAPRQTVNIVCRKLSGEGLIRRERGPRGKLVNILVTGLREASIPAPPKQVARTKGQPGTSITEDQVKASLAKMLEADGWSVQVAWGRAQGIDIEAKRGNDRWVIECKGPGSSPPMQNNYFVGVVGELLQRMHDDGAKHSIAFPDLPKFRRLWSELPLNVKQRLRLTVLFVAADETVQELVV